MRVYVFEATYLVYVADPESLGEDRAKDMVPEVLFGGTDHPWGYIEREEIKYHDDYDGKDEDWPR